MLKTGFWLSLGGNFRFSYGRDFQQGKTNLEDGPDSHFTFDSDIAAVCGAISIRVVDGFVADARVAFGGMAAIPKRAKRCEAALKDAPWCEATLEAAAEAIARDFAPISDLRGSSSYRITVAANLLRRMWAARNGEPISVLAEVEPC